MNTPARCGDCGLKTDMSLITLEAPLVSQWDVDAGIA